MDFPENRRAAPERRPRPESRAARRNAAKWLRAAMPQQERRKVSISGMMRQMRDRGLTWPPDGWTRALLKAMRTA